MVYVFVCYEVSYSIEGDRNCTSVSRDKSQINDLSRG